MSRTLSVFVGLTSLHTLSVVVCVLLITGVLVRRRRSLHIPLMAGAIAIDLGIVLIIELGRGALQQAQAKMGLLIVVHIAISVAVLVGYAIQVVTGIRKLRGRPSRVHPGVMPLLLAARLANLATSIIVMT
ncbi:MAG: hypothetical protein ACYSUI_01305 [Planctomycetota bacterium]|jgi:hypothetical protein